MAENFIEICGLHVSNEELLVEGVNQLFLPLNKLNVLLKMAQTRSIYHVHLSKIFCVTPFHIASL